MHRLLGSFRCKCGANFAIYHHRAHPENLGEQVAWLEAVLEKEHTNSPEHRDSYRYPL